MEFRNAVYSSADKSSIDVEINHPSYGWVPYTASLHDKESTGRDVYRAAVSTGGIAPYDPSRDEIWSAYVIAKTTPWLRMSDAEASTMEAALASATPRLRQIYTAAQYLSSSDPFWTTLLGLLTDAFGAVRAAELLAPERS